MDPVDSNSKFVKESSNTEEKKTPRPPARRPRAVVAEKTGFEPDNVGSMANEVKKVQTGKKIPVSPVRKMGGKRVHHLKKDILPWISNIYESGKRSNEMIFNMLVTRINRHPGLTDENRIGLINDAKQRLDYANKQLKISKDKILKVSELNENTHTPLAPNDQMVQKYKNLSKIAQSSVHNNIKSFINGLENVRMDNFQPIPSTLKDEISLFTEGLKKNVENIEGLKRFEIIHEDEFWNPEHITQRFMPFSNGKVKPSVLAVSAFQAEGPGYSSQAPRNRKEDDVHAANFVRSTFSVKPEGAETLECVLDVTRSAITVEFDQPNANERRKCNEKLVGQVIGCQIEHKLLKLSPEEIESATNSDTPLVLKSQTVNLLTPDKIRSIVRENESIQSTASYFHLSGAPADDERALMLENIEAHNALNGKVISYIMYVDDKKMTIFVKLDLRYFNIPNNKAYEKSPEFITESVEANSANSLSWVKLEEDVKQNLEVLTNEMILKQGDLSPEEKKMHDAIMEKELIKDILREEIHNETGQNGLKHTRKKFEEWQKIADEIAVMRSEMESLEKSTPAFKEILKISKKRSDLIDLYVDTKELFLTGLSTNVKNMDNNRSALATRIILLAAMVDDIEVHFGCRSGKDRTGLVDIELKLLLIEGVLNGRLPSYREEERLPDIINHREIMTQESGNTFDFVRANLGASVGLNTGGSASAPLEKNEAGKQYQEFTEAAQAFAKMASRPPTNCQIPPAKFEKKQKP